MGMAKNVKRTMEDLKKPRLHGPSRSSPSLKFSISPWAWKASLFFWRRWLKKNPPKPHVIKPASSTSASASASAQDRTSCARSKHVPMPSKYTAAKNRNFFYYSYPDHNPSVGGKSVYGCCDVVKSKTRPHPPYTTCITPTSCDNCPPNLDSNPEYHNPLPYFQLRHTQCVPLSRRLPIYIVS